MRLEHDLAARAQPHPQQRRPHDLAEPGLGQQQDVLLAAAQHHERRDDPRLRGEQQRLARVAGLERRDLVRDHPLEVRDRVGPGHARRTPWDAAQSVTSRQSSPTRVAIVFRSKAERKVQAAGYDPARLPPGQYLTEKWPVLHAGDVAELPARPRGLEFSVPGRSRSRSR